MRRRLAISALLALVIGIGAAAASGESFQKNNIRIAFSGGFTPHSLPRERAAPVTIELESSIETTDGSQPPALQTLEVALNSRGHLSTRGLPTCTTAALQSTTSDIALARCRDALVGHGSFGAALASTQAQIPARGKILAFNGTRGANQAVLLHLYGTVPVQATFVLPLKINRQKGQLGTVLATKIPVLAGGLGSITEVKLTIGRTYGFEGRRLSFLSASCSAPAGFESVPSFPFARGRFHFADGTQISTPLNRNCRVR